ncbi:MAG TPA: hypothetical protein VFC80_00550 [Sphaerochaeta sp.]|nr:hypothetical protein [Sphaerochaeta sp.]
MWYQVQDTEKGVRYCIHWHSTLLYALFASLFLYLLQMGVADGSSWLSLALIILLFLLSLGGALYRDSWYFLPAEELVITTWGFGPFVRRNTIQFSVIERLDVTRFYKGSTTDRSRIGLKRATAMVNFRLILVEGEERTIQLVGERKSAGTIAAARKIAAATGLALSIDRPKNRDTQLRLSDL